MKKLTYLLFLFFLISCNGKKHKDSGSEALKKELKMRKITRLKDGDIGQYVLDLGRKLLNLREKPELAKAFYDKYKVKLSFLKSEEESENHTLENIKEAYQFEFSQRKPLTNNIQHQEGEWLFTSPKINFGKEEPSLEGIWYFQVSTKDVILMQD